MQKGNTNNFLMTFNIEKIMFGEMTEGIERYALLCSRGTESSSVCFEFCMFTGVCFCQG
jgi:hypothetical protein